MMRLVDGHFKEPVSKSRSAPIKAGPLKDVRIYLSNLPPNDISAHMTNAAWLRQFAGQYGEVQIVDIIASRVASGSKIGFIHMSSEAHADEFIKHINCLRLNGKWVKAHKEKVCEAPTVKKDRSLPKLRGTVSVDSDGFVTRQVRHHSAGGVKAESAKTLGRPSGFAALLDLEEEGISSTEEEEELSAASVDEELPELEEMSFEEMYDEVREEIPSPVVINKEEDVSPAGVMSLNPWENAERNVAMRQDLARRRKEDEDIVSALEADAFMRRNLVEDARNASIATANRLAAVAVASNRIPASSSAISVPEGVECVAPSESEESEADCFDSEEETPDYRWGEESAYE